MIGFGIASTDLGFQPRDFRLHILDRVNKNPQLGHRFYTSIGEDGSFKTVIKIYSDVTVTSTALLCEVNQPGYSTSSDPNAGE